MVHTAEPTADAGGRLYGEAGGGIAIQEHFDPLKHPPRDDSIHEDLGHGTFGFLVFDFWGSGFILRVSGVGGRG